MVKNLFLIQLLVCHVLVGFGQKKSSTETFTSAPFVLGLIDEIQSKELSEKRVLNIYLPEGYLQNDSIRYPVIYLLDGSANEYFIHVVGLVQFNTFEWVNQIPKSIIVGIASVDRRRDFTFPSTVDSDKRNNPTSGHSDKFIAFIEKELQPYIESKYKTNSQKTLIGQSLGGLLATQVLLQKPTLFNRYIIVSPSLWWNNGSLLNDSSVIFTELFKQRTEIYIGVGKEGLTPAPTPHVMEVDANALADRIKRTNSKTVTVFFDYLPQENHATIMHQAVFNAFKLLFKSKH